MSRFNNYKGAVEAPKKEAWSELYSLRLGENGRQVIACRFGISKKGEDFIVLQGREILIKLLQQAEGKNITLSCNREERKEEIEETDISQFIS